MKKIILKFGMAFLRFLVGIGAIVIAIKGLTDGIWATLWMSIMGTYLLIGGF
ncbi:hypothetical protein [Scopulibacillus darangshiensis]|uniref:hypothetical protein n=1 Tax=Scopulibacillus darangshiensis TaxID=442528 RepID=UPI00140550FD|nr:hypothetical protein [Scopulibacillus darangshiensis]